MYGILINNQNQLLVSDEVIKGTQFTKFPGGGLEWGEGAIACLEREFMEELNQPIKVGSIIIQRIIFSSRPFENMIN